eukprot:202325-Pleurochrysis_carterae.AAC.8
MQQHGLRRLGDSRLATMPRSQSQRPRDNGGGPERRARRVAHRVGAKQAPSRRGRLRGPTIISVIHQ